MVGAPIKRGGITQGSDIYGPIDVTDFFQRNGIDLPPNCNAQVFLVDTEGYNSLDGSPTNKAIFAIQQISTLLVSFIRENPTFDTFKSIQKCLRALA